MEQRLLVPEQCRYEYVVAATDEIQYKINPIGRIFRMRNDTESDLLFGAAEKFTITALLAANEIRSLLPGEQRTMVDAKCRGLLLQQGPLTLVVMRSALDGLDPLINTNNVKH